MDLCFSHNSLKTTIFTRSRFSVVVFLFFFLSSEDFHHRCARDAAAAGVRTWLPFGFSEQMSRAGLLPPRSGVFAPTRVGLDLL